MKRRFGSLYQMAVLWMIAGLVLNGSAFAQGPPARPPQKPPVNQSNDPVLKPFRFRAIGPASMGGRIDDFAVVETNPFIYYVGLATGGVWKTTNNGTTFEPIFDQHPVSSIGDLAICQSNPDTLWVGTGEPNNRQSSTIGDGIYKSTDAGKTFTNMGLKETQTIARIVVDPKDCNTVYVAAVGHLFGPTKERGVYKTTDGGKSWASVKFIDEDTGFTDIVIDPVDSRTLYAASYQRRRTPWGFNGGGPGSAIWKTIDAGKTWAKLEGAGLPQGTFGRIGLDVFRSNPNVVYAQIEVGAGLGTGGGGEPTPEQVAQQMRQQQQQGQTAPPDPSRSGVWRSDDKGKTWRLMSNNNNRPMYYSQIRVDPKNDQIVYTCGAPFHKSTDGGKTFQQVDGIAHSDHHAVWINPQNTNHIMIGTDGGLDVSYDQAATWEFVNTIPVGQFYAVAADMRKPYYVYGGLQDNGSWGGPSQTRGPGITNSDWYRIGGGDGFYVQIDPTDHTTVYVESQNGNIQRLDLKTGRSISIRPRAAQRPRQQPRPAGPAPGAEDAPPAGAQPPQSSVQRPAAQPTAGQQAAQPTAEQVAFAQQMMQQFGGGNPQVSNIVPAPPVGEQYRYNWNTPVALSPHNPRTVYTGANKFFKSVDRGDTWTASADLTKQIDRNKLSIMNVPGDKPMASKHDGASNYGNITTIAESPMLPGVLWVGTDDGNLQLSRDGGATWTNVVKNIKGVGDTYQVSRVEPSRFDAATCYVTFDGHRENDWKPYVFVTRDYGATWQSMANNLPAFGNVNVIREDVKNKNLLFVGTEFGLYISQNGGAQWKRFMTGLPVVRIDDILIHPRDNDLIVGTHGRSIYIVDDITPLQQMSGEMMAKDAHLFDVRPGTQWLRDVTLARYTGGAKNYIADNPPAGTAISYYLKSTPSGDVKITVSDITGKVLRNITGTKEAGLNRVQWDLRGDAPPRPQGFPGGQGGGGGGGRRFQPQGQPFDPGVYMVKLTVDGKEFTTKVVVEADDWKDR